MSGDTRSEGRTAAAARARRATHLHTHTQACVMNPGGEGSMLLAAPDADAFCETTLDAGMLGEGTRGLGFGVRSERACARSVTGA